MKRVAIVSFAILGLILGAAATRQPGRALAQSDEALPQGFKVTPVLKSTQTASSMAIEYPKGKAELVSVLGQLEPGGRTSLHQHPVPVFVYVLEGTLVVQAQGGSPREYQPGQAFVEDVNHWHQAFNKGSAPVKILVVFVGEEGKPTTINAK
jgi:quercetin dioxygenase-like cupin family protein